MPSPEGLDALLGTAPRLGVRRASERSMARLYGPDLGELADFVTVGDAIGDLDPENTCPIRSAYARGLGAGGPPQNHEPWAHSSEFVARLAAVPRAVGSPWPLPMGAATIPGLYAPAPPRPGAHHHDELP